MRFYHNQLALSTQTETYYIVTWKKHEDVKNTILLFDSDNLQKSSIFRGYKIALSVGIIWISACPPPPFGLCRQSLALQMLP